MEKSKDTQKLNFNFWVSLEFSVKWSFLQSGETNGFGCTQSVGETVIFKWCGASSLWVKTNYISMQYWILRAELRDVDKSDGDLAILSIQKINKCYV